MTTRPQRRQRPRRSAGSVARGLLALAAIAVLLVGIPAALIAVGGNPLPDSLPSWGDVTSALTSPDDGSLFLGALLWLAWLGWAGFAAGIVVEIPAAFRGRRARRIPLLHMQQRAAAGLVATVAALFVVGPVGVAAASGLPHDSVQPQAPPSTSSSAETADRDTGRQTAPAAERPSSAGAAASEQRTAERQPTRTHVVGSGESLWRIADEQLGDGARWPEIAELNYGIEQPGGGALDGTHWIAPGWRLALPATSESTAPATTSEGATSGKATSERQTSHVVVEGDTLWDIAESHLGDGSRYPELFEASRGTIQPDGRQLRDPDLIVPGWTITIPSVGPVTEKPPEDQKPPVERPPAEEPPADPPVEEPPVDEQPPVEPPAEEPPVGEEPPVDEEAQVGAPGDTGADADAFPVRTAAGVGSLLAAGVLAYLAIKRRTQQRRRDLGERIAMPAGAVAGTEQELRTVADPMSVETVDVALRGLSLSCARRGVPLPPLRIARLTAEQFELYLTDSADLPSPFVPTDEGHVWFLPVTARPEFDPAELQDVAAPYPSLVTIGHGPEDGHLLLDLERLGTLTVTGSADRSQEVMAALAVELATSPWADDLQVTLVGTCHELADGLDTGRVRHLPSVGRLLDDLAARAGSDRAALDRSGASSLDDARLRGVAAATWTPEIVLLAHPLSDDQHRRLLELVESVPRVAVAAVTHDDDAVGTWALELSDTDPDTAVLQPVGVEVNPQRLAHEQYLRILDLLGIAEQPAHVPAHGELPGRSLLPDDQYAPESPTVDDAPLEGSGAAGHSGVHPEPVPDLETQLAGLGSRAADVSAPGEAAGEFSSVGRAHEPPEPAGAATVDAPAATVPSEDGPTVLLLGPVDVENAHGPLEQSKYRQLTEIAAYIALHPGLDYSALDEAIWPGNRVTQNTRNTAISKLRRWFGRDGQGDDYLPRVDSGYRFHPAVDTDWDRWMYWVGPNPMAAGTDELLRGLELVRGQPFTGVNPRRYTWAEHIKQDMISAIVDAAHELARRGLAAGDAHLARKAATIGLQVEPGMEVLWRDRIKAEHLAGNRAGIDDAVARLTAISDDLGDELEEATVGLIEQLVSGRGEVPAL